MTAPAADDQAVLIIPPEGSSATALVRLWVAAALDGVPLVPRLRTALVVTELVDNAYRHGRLPCVLRLALDDSRRFLYVFVEDAGAVDDPRWTIGAGLSLVDGLTSHWAVEQRPHGKTVWGEIALEARIRGINAPPQPPPRAWRGRGDTSMDDDRRDREV